MYSTVKFYLMCISKCVMKFGSEAQCDISHDMALLEHKGLRALHKGPTVDFLLVFGWAWNLNLLISNPEPEPPSHECVFNSFNNAST